MVVGDVIVVDRVCFCLVLLLVVVMVRFVVVFVIISGHVCLLFCVRIVVA